MTQLAPPRPVGVLSPALEAELGNRLQAQRDFRLAQLAQLDRVGRPGPWGSANREVCDSLAAGARAALREVRAALRRIEQRRYGRCIGCGAGLDVERLQLVPQTARCLNCH